VCVVVCCAACSAISAPASRAHPNHEIYYQISRTPSRPRFNNGTHIHGRKFICRLMLALSHTRFAFPTQCHALSFLLRIKFNKRESEDSIRFISRIHFTRAFARYRGPESLKIAINKTTTTTRVREKLHVSTCCLADESMREKDKLLCTSH
jgi:hypothetical protein